MLAPAPAAKERIFAPADWPRLPSHRDAEPFEDLRAASEAKRIQTGERPRLFLANLGTIEGFAPRAVFAQNLFAAGGLEVLSNAGFATAQEAAAAFRLAQCRIACICASDAAAAEIVMETARALAGAGAKFICFAAPPGDLEAAMREAGIGEFAYPGCNALAILERALARVG